MLILSLPWPDKRLSPNARLHWSKKARVVKQAREDAAWWAIHAGVKPSKAKSLNVVITFIPPDARRRDDDNLIGMMKPARDGIADVIRVDDSQWSTEIRREPPKHPGSVKIQISEVQA